MAKIATFYDHIKDIARQEGMRLMDALGTARELGVEALEISQNNLIGREDEVGQELASYDMGISSIPSYFNFGRDRDVKRQALPTLEAAQYLGAKRLLVIPGFLDLSDSPEERESQTQAMVEGVAQLAELAAPYGVDLAMEEYDDPKAPFCNTTGVERFLEACPELGCCFDSGNFLPAGEDVLQALDRLQGRVTHVHLKDRAFAPTFAQNGAAAQDGRLLYPAPVGQGDLPLGDVVSRLRQGGYQGAYTLEFYGSPRTLEFLQDSVAWLTGELEAW